MTKYFTEKQVGVSALVGGPIPPGILFYLNYRRIGKDKEAYISLVVTFIFTIGLFYTLFLIPDDILKKIPNALFTGIYGIIIYLGYRKFLASEIKTKLDGGASAASNWLVAGYTVLGLLITGIIIIGMAFSLPPFSGDKLTYGKTNNEIYYDKATTSERDVNALAEMLTTNGFFTDEYTLSVQLETWKTRNVITFQVEETYWKDEEVMDFFEFVKVEMAVVYQKDVSVVLETYDLSGKRSEKRF